MRQKYEFKSIVAETLLIPLYMRAKESRRNNPILYDKAAEWLADSLEYDYSQFDGAKLSEVGCVVRGWYFDCAVRRFIKAHSHPVVVNVGCGLDTCFQRIGSQKAVFYDLDLPEVIALRRELIPEQPDNVYIEASLLETDWMDDLRRKHPEAEFIFIVEGVLMYFYEKQVKSFLHHSVHAGDSSSGRYWGASLGSATNSVHCSDIKSHQNSVITMEKSKKKKGLSRLFEIAGQRKGLLILAGLLSAGSAVCMLVPYWAVYEILKELLSNGSNLSALDGTYMMRWGWIAFGGLVGGLVLLYAALMSSHVAAFRILYGLRVRLSEHIGKLPLGYLNNTSTGAIKKTMDQNIEKIEGFIAHTIPDLVNVVATVAVMLVIFFSLDVWLTVVCLAVVMISLFLQFSNFMGKRAREFMSIYYDAQEKMSASAVQYVRGMPVVKIFGQSVRSFRQFNTEIQAYKTFALKCCDTYQNGMIAFTVLLNSMVTFILPMGILLLQASPQSLSLAVVWLFFIIMGPGMASPVYKLTFLGGNTRDINEGVNRIDRILEKKPVPEPGHPQVPPAYDVEFRHVSFFYENTEQGTRTEALRDVSFKAPQGKITALVGPSGSGKSTVANLIPRFWDVEQGEICIGGIDIRQIDTAKLMDMVSFVFQDTFLFYDTLYENIAVGSPDATKEKVIAAAKAAQCHDFIERLPQGYETRIGDRRSHCLR